MLRKVVQWTFLTGIGGVVGSLLLAHLIILPYGKYIVRDSVPTSSTALIFGGGMKDPTTMSEMQEDRVIRGIELYKEGKVAKLVMTGDDGQNRFDEVHAMEAYAIQNGVPDMDVDIDPHGYRTYESCYRAKHVYGTSNTIVISQSFHLPRILYLCRRMGIEAVGVPADLRDYRAIWTPYGREALARVKAVLEREVMDRVIMERE